MSERRQTESSINDTFQNVDEQLNSSDESRKVTKKRKSTKSIDNENELIKQLSHRLSNRMSKPDEQLDNIDSDKHFLRSLYDRFKAIDNNLKLQAQIEIMNVIQKCSQPNTQNYNYELVSRRLDNALSYSYNTTEYEKKQYQMYPHTKYPSHIELSPFRAPITVNIPEMSPTTPLSIISSDSISSQATDDDHDSILLNIFNKNYDIYING